MKQDLEFFLKRLRAHGVENNIPNVTDEVGKFLNILIQIRKPATILEIGCANGYSTIWMAEAARKVGAMIHTIDHSAPTFAEAQKNLKEVGLFDSVEFHFGDAVEVIDQMNADIMLDFVFVDGQKASYLDFWKAIEDRLLPDAVVVFDDMMAFPAKTKPFHDFIQLAEGIDQVLIPIDEKDGILLVVKK